MKTKHSRLRLGVKPSVVVDSDDDDVEFVRRIPAAKRKRGKGKKAKKRRRRVIESSDDDDDDEEEEEEEEEENEESEDDGSNEVDELLQSCEGVSNQMIDLMTRSGLEGSVTDIVGGKDGIVGPAEAKSLMKGITLKGYQLAGLNWAHLLYKLNANGVLADEMGLGKTVQSLALLSLLKARYGISGPHLICVPASVLENWRTEGHTHFSVVVVYHGTQAARSQIRREVGARVRESLNVLLTTYTTFERDSSSIDRDFISKFRFEYVVFDEAHAIKNHKSKRYRRLSKLKCKRQLLLTERPSKTISQSCLASCHFVFQTVSRRLPPARDAV